MPNSSIRGRDGLYYRIPDFDELDGYDNFNAQDYASNMADDLQLSDLDPASVFCHPAPPWAGPTMMKATTGCRCSLTWAASFPRQAMESG